MPSKKVLRGLFRYDPQLGCLINIVRRGRAAPGARSAHRTTMGYRACKIRQRRFFEHRLIWIFHYGPMPTDKCIDHINHDKEDNRIENLRLVTPYINMHNLSLYCTNNTGIAGVSYNRRRGYWHARIRVGTRELTLGSFKNRRHAIIARKTGERILDYHKNHGRLTTVQCSQPAQT